MKKVKRIMNVLEDRDGRLVETLLAGSTNDVEIRTDDNKNLIGFPHRIILHLAQTAVIHISHLYLRNLDYLGRKSETARIKHQSQDSQLLLGKVCESGMGR